MDEADVSENLRREQMQQQTISGLGKLGQPPLILLPAMFCGAHNVVPGGHPDAPSAVFVSPLGTPTISASHCVCVPGGRPHAKDA
eukprot:scaffold314854_cov15-Tisochrysis_lutea.AAC.1